MARRLCIALALVAISACAQSVTDAVFPASGNRMTPRYRASGDRIPAFSGGDPGALGLTRADDLLWMSAEDAEAFGRGWVRLGAAYVRTSETTPSLRPADDALVLRTDHVLVRSNLGFEAARNVARRAEAHVLRLLLTYGDVYDLRLPLDPLPIVVHASRAEFEAALRGITVDPIGWGAFYDTQTGTVYLSTEPAKRGGLPWIADLRHEMTHQILDLSRPPWKRRRAFGAGWFWLWEGAALHAETLGDAPGTDSQALRLARFRTRLGRGEALPLERLFRLRQHEFEGRHYDQTAALMRYLLDPERPAQQRGVYRLVSRLLQGKVAPRELEPALGVNLTDLERAWLAAMRR